MGRKRRGVDTVGDREDLVRRALEDLERDDVTAEAWVQIYGRRLAEEVSASNALLKTARGTARALLDMLTRVSQGMGELRAALALYQITTRQVPTPGGSRRTPKTSSRQRRDAAGKLATACETVTARFLAEAEALAPPSGLRGDQRRSHEGKVAARVAGRLREFVTELRASGSTGAAVDRAVKSLDRLRPRHNDVDLSEESDEDEVVH